MFIPDPDRPAKPEHAARHQRRQRAKAGLANQPEGSGKIGKGTVPFATTPEDRLRIKLREKQRSVSKIHGAKTELVTLPGLHALSLATRYIDGGRDRFLEFVQMAAFDNHPAAVAWWTVFADLTPSERDIVSFDDVCAASGVRPSDFMALIVKSAMEFGRDVGNLVAALMHPEIVKQAAASAQRIDGDYVDVSFKDRTQMLQHQHFLPLPKGVSINVNASATAQAAAAAAAEPTVPSFARDMGSVNDVRTQQQLEHTQRRLPARAPLTAAEELFGDGAADADGADPSTTAVEAVLISPDE